MDNVCPTNEAELVRGPTLSVVLWLLHYHNSLTVTSTINYPSSSSWLAAMDLVGVAPIVNSSTVNVFTINSSTDSLSNVY